MAHPLVSKKRARVYSSALFLFFLASLFLFPHQIWPGIMLAIGLPLALRQYLLGRLHDALISLLVFGGVYVAVAFTIPWRFFLPALFSVAAIYLLAREYLESGQESEEEKEADKAKEIEEDQK